MNMFRVHLESLKPLEIPMLSRFCELAGSRFFSQSYHMGGNQVLNNVSQVSRPRFSVCRSIGVFTFLLEHRVHFGVEHCVHRF